MPEKKPRDPIPEHFNGIEDAGEFWDEHDLTDYEDIMRETYFTVELRPIMDFEKFWTQLRRHLYPRLVLPNWTADKGYIGGQISIVSVSDMVVDVESPTAKNIQRVEKSDFEEVWNVWQNYKAGKIRRSDMSPLTRNSKYVITIFHWYESEMDK
ncbi:MAG: hypothetical protein AB1846_12485 [Chloroflexota bacterium]